MQEKNSPGASPKLAEEIAQLEDHILPCATLGASGSTPEATKSSGVRRTKTRSTALDRSSNFSEDSFARLACS